MAFDIRTFVKGPVKFIPKFEGNDKSDNPVTVTIDSRIDYAGTIKDYSATTREELVAKKVTAIENLTINGEPITTGKALVEALKKNPVSPMWISFISEIAADMMSEAAIDKDDSKN